MNTSSRFPSPLSSKSFSLRYLPFKNQYFNVFFICFVSSLIIFLPFMILDRGFFFYYGDFNVQQIPFYVHAHEAVRNGQFFWDWGTDLGSNFIGSYSFYLLTSPFFWLTVPFPTSVVPALLAPLLMLKFACAGVTAFALIKRFVKNPLFAMIGAMLYAFSGFNQFNIFFNHFHEVVVFFPLLLVALEEAVMNKRRGVFALAIFANSFINYFFFIGQVTFVLIYFLVRCLSPDFRVTIKDLLLLALETIIGLMLAAFILIPSFLSISNNPRTNSLAYGMDIFLYHSTQRYGHILSSLFFPPDVPSRPNFFPESNAKWASVSLYLPFFSLTGVVVFLKNTKKHWLKTLMIICFIMALIPFLNSAFFAFNSSYYARWFYMPILLMALATSLALEYSKDNFSSGIRFCTIAVISFAFIGIVPTKDNQGVVSWFSLAPFPERVWIYVGIAGISLLLIYFLFKIPRYSKRFAHLSILFTCVISIVSTTTTITLGKLHATSNPYDKLINQGLRGLDNLSFTENNEDDFFRIDTNNVLDNIPMFWGLPTIRAFHSIVPVSIMNFYQQIDEKRDVASRPEMERYGIRALTSVKYLLESNENNQTAFLPGFVNIGQQNGFDVLQNQYFIPMGFTYDHYVTEEMIHEVEKNKYDLLMLRGLFLSPEDSVRYNHLLTPLPNSRLHSLDESEYYSDCQQRAQVTSQSFSYNTHGFTSTIDLPKDNLVFFSVPAEEGWRAFVDNVEVDIVKANIGFMAVETPAGFHTIEFRYHTPGLSIGWIITIIGGLFIFLYFWICRYFRRQKRYIEPIEPYYHCNLLSDDTDRELLSVQKDYIFQLTHHDIKPDKNDPINP